MPYLRALKALKVHCYIPFRLLIYYALKVCTLFVKKKYILLSV